ncbi:hypothetical protein ACR6C2_35900 [Streptomyces sp. INA 01156]
MDDGIGHAITAAIQRLRRVHTPRLPIEVTVRPSVRQVSLSEKTPGRTASAGCPARPAAPLEIPDLPVGAGQTRLPAHPGRRLRRRPAGDRAAVRHGLHRRGPRARHRPLAPPRAVPPHAPTGTDSVRDLNATARMRRLLRQGLTALQEHRPDIAEDRLGQAARLAARLGTDWVLDEIRTVADIEDAAAGLVRLGAVDTGSLGPMILRAGSRPGGPLADAVGARPGPRCGGCGTPAGSEARYCIACGEKLL